MGNKILKGLKAIAFFCYDKIKNVILPILPFFLMDFFIRSLAARVRYNVWTIRIPSVLFSVVWIGLIFALSFCFRRKIGRIIYSVLFAIFFVMFLTYSIYFSYTGFFFSFNLVESAGEGSAYILDTLASVPPATYLIMGLVLAVGLFVIIKFPKVEKNRWKTLIAVLIAFVVLHMGIPHFLGKANTTLTWDTWNNPRNVYESFGDSNKNIKICGFYEYCVRDFYVTFLRHDNEEKPEEIEFLDNMYAKQTPHAKNDYTGIFKGKNIIFIQLEGIDNWLLTEQDMPNLYGMTKNSIVFDNHYSYYNGGGSTFNSELAVTTGLLTPVSYTRNPYSFNNNHFPYSLPNQLKKLGYSANAFHMNTGEYYMRSLNYKNWGYEKYHSLLDDCGYTNDSYQMDTELILNPTFYENMFKKDEPFMNYVITYTTHMPFQLDSQHGRMVGKKNYGEEESEFPQLTEEEAVKLFAKETDDMIGLMLEALKREGLYENTVIVAFSDHYLYTLADKTILDKYKTTENNLINHTPFLIWSADIAETHVEKVNSQIDILPTVLNMLGVEYCDENYIGNDIMGSNYPGYVFFADYSWYDGKNYVELGGAVNGEDVDEKYISEMNDKINNIIRKNDLTLKYDYFGR